MTYIQGEPRVLGLGWLFHCVPECAWADGSLAEWTEQLVKTGGTSKVDPIQVSEVIVYPVYSGGRGTFNKWLFVFMLFTALAPSLPLIAFSGEDDSAACRINAITGAPMSQFLGPRFKGRSRSPSPSLWRKKKMGRRIFVAFAVLSSPFLSDLRNALFLRPLLLYSCTVVATPLPRILTMCQKC